MGSPASNRTPGTEPSRPVPPAKRSAWDFALRPGSLEHSTSLWWTAPPVVAWIAIAAASVVAQAIRPHVYIGRSILVTLLIDLAGTSAWAALVVATQSERATELPDGTIDPRGRHEFWRVRTVAWDLLTVSVVGVLLVGLLLAGPSTVLPAADVPLFELAVLIATIVLLATFSRYAAMAFNTDAARTIQKLEELSDLESTGRQRDTERVTATFTS
jgi:hypothetical protein